LTTPVTSAETRASSSPLPSTPWLTNCAPHKKRPVRRLRGKATHVLARVRASARRPSHDQVVGLRPGRAAALLGRGMVPGGVVAPWQAAPSASMRSAAIHPGLTPGPRPIRVWRPSSACMTAVAQTPEVARPAARTGGTSARRAWLRLPSRCCACWCSRLRGTFPSKTFTLICREFDLGSSIIVHTTMSCGRR